MDRLDVIRINIDNTTSLIDVDLNKALKDNPNHNIILKPNDIVKVYDNEDMEYKTGLEIRGHVKKPRKIPFRKGMQLYDLLFEGGGFNNEEHLKNTYFEKAILTRRNDKDFGTRDIPFRVDSVLAGKGLANEMLKMGDVVTIFSLDRIKGEQNKFVEIVGNVKRPGIYNRSDNMRLSSLLFLGGGFKDTVFSKSIFMERADLIRSNDSVNSSQIISFSLFDIMNDKNEDKDIILKDGDKVRVYSKRYFDFSKTVEIQGVIKSPGQYSIKEGMSLMDLILEAGGVDSDLYNLRYEISRLNKMNSQKNHNVKIISGEFKNEMKSYLINDKRNKILLKPYDLIILRPDPFFKKQSLVSLSGFVLYPGLYALKSHNEKVTDLIKRAGGLRDDAYPNASKLIRDNEEVKISFNEIMRNPRSKKNFTLMEGDSIFIGSKPNLIKIFGEVNTPGNYQYIRGKDFNQYIKSAGGYTRNAARAAIIIRFPNGRTKKMGLLSFSPKIIDGCEIFVGKKEDVEPFSFTEYVTNVTQIYADLTQAYLMILLAAR